MRFKYYLRGIGIGVTLATLLLTISFYFGKDYLVKPTLTEEEIIEKATALGMVMPESEEEEANSEEQQDTVVEDNSEEALNVEETISADSAISDEQVPLAGSQEDSKEEATSESEDETVTYVPFTVRGGESSEVISSHLKDAGLVDDSDAFNKYLHTCKVDHRIQNGTFYVKQGSSYDDLIAILVNKDVRTTTPPKN